MTVNKIIEQPISYIETAYIVYDWLMSIVEQEGISVYKLSKDFGYSQANLSKLIKNIEQGTPDQIKSIPASYLLIQIADCYGYQLPNIDRASISDIKKRAKQRYKQKQKQKK